ncbi:MAG: alternative ribosome rescue aminoacyl-tRNA hydrolase ArfB [Fibrobacterota bacterium]
MPIIPENEIKFKFTSSGGPGGQHVNRNSTAVQLRFNFRESGTISDYLKNRLDSISDSRISNGRIIIDASRYKSRDMNKKDSLRRLQGLLEKASKKRKKRKRTRPTRSSVEKRIGEKKKRSEKLRNRKLQ